MRLLWVAGTVVVVTVGAIGVNAQTSAPAKTQTPAKPQAPATPAAKPAATKLPAAVEAKFKADYPNAKITGVSKEVEDGKTVYEVESMDGTKGRDLVYAADGTVLTIEEALTAAEFPAPAAAALKVKYPKATVTKYEKVTQGTTITYEAQLKGAPVKELVFKADGTIVPPKTEPKK